MTNKKVLSNTVLQEVLFQAFLLIMVFVFYAFDREKGQSQIRFDQPHVVFFLNYAAAAYIINYWFLPRLLYRKKYWQFTIGVVAVVALSIGMEELVLEQIYYPDTRGSRFPGVFFSLMGVMPTITILAGFKFAWDALTKQRQLEKLEMAVKESELQFLKSQINPHFLFNNLNNLYSYALEQSPKTPNIILELSGLLRYMLYECKAQYVPLQKEVEQLGNFVNLSRLQMEGRGEVHFESRVDDPSYKVAPLILSVFVENAFKHSLSSVGEDIEIKIHLSVNEQGRLQFICQNTFNEQSNTGDLSKGIGLENVRKRLRILYPKAHQMDIKTQNGCYTVALTIDLQKAL